jgi:hypothetical protein
MPAEYTGLKTRCHIWTGGIAAGYGAFWLDGKQWKAHRAAYQMKFGLLHDGTVVLHRCDTRACVNTDHLLCGTQLDNMRDMVAKGRQAVGHRNGHYTHPERTARGERHSSKTHPELILKGEDNPASKLTAEQVRDIRRRYKPGVISQQQLADEFGVCQGLIGFIIRRKSWRHIV